MRYLLAIIEDEPYAARFIERVVRDTGLFEVAGCFGSAEELLASPVCRQADALVTDIRLGGMDGLTMLRKISEMNPLLHSVIVSGYDSFEYARDAVQLHVIRYLLKPIDVEELKAALTALYRVTDESRAGHERESLLAVTDLGARFAAGEVILSAPWAYVMLAFGFKNREEMLLACRRRFPASEGVLVFPYRHAVVLAAGCHAPDDPDPFVRGEGLVMTAMPDTLTAFVCRSAEALPADNLFRLVDRMYMNAINGLQPGVRRTAVYEPDSPYPVPDDEIRRTQERLAESLMQRTREDCERSLTEAFEAWERRKAPLFAMRHCLLGYTDRLLSLSGAYADTERAEVRACMAALYTADSYEEAAAKVIELLGPLIAKSLEERSRSQKQSHRLYEQITEFLQKNIGKNYSLQEIGDFYGISQPYVSKLFRTYYGGSYKDYVTAMKIGEAKRLMEADSRMMIKDVAERVGYEQLYFSTVFHRITGQYPRDYRKQASETDPEKPQDSGE